MQIRVYINEQICKYAYIAVQIDNTDLCKYIDTCECIYMHKHGHVNMHILRYICIYKFATMCERIYCSTYVYIRINVNAQICINAYIIVHSYITIYVCTHTCKYIDTGKKCLDIYKYEHM